MNSIAAAGCQGAKVGSFAGGHNVVVASMLAAVTWGLQVFGATAARGGLPKTAFNCAARTKGLAGHRLAAPVPCDTRLSNGVGAPGPLGGLGLHASPSTVTAPPRPLSTAFPPSPVPAPGLRLCVQGGPADRHGLPAGAGGGGAGPRGGGRGGGHGDVPGGHRMSCGAWGEVARCTGVGVTGQSWQASFLARG